MPPRPAVARGSPPKSGRASNSPPCHDGVPPPCAAQCSSRPAGGIAGSGRCCSDVYARRGVHLTSQIAAFPRDTAGITRYITPCIPADAGTAANRYFDFSRSVDMMTNRATSMCWFTTGRDSGRRRSVCRKAGFAGGHRVQEKEPRSLRGRCAGIKRSYCSRRAIRRSTRRRCGGR